MQRLHKIMKCNIFSGTSAALVSSFLLLMLLLSSGCDDTPTELEDYNPEAVLTGYIFNGEPVDKVYLERVAPIEGSYDFADHGIVGASIMLSGGGDTLHFADDPTLHGCYIPAAGESLVPRSLVVYRFEATTPDNEYLWAEARMPGKLDSVNVVLIDDLGNFDFVENGDTLNRNMSNMYWQWPEVDSVGGFQGKIMALTERDSLVPLSPSWDPDDPDDELEEIDRGRAGWTLFRYDQRVVTIPWIFFEWEGPTLIELYAINNEYWDYLYSMMRNQQGMGINLSTNMNGGLGIFGTISRYGFEIYMEKVEPLE